MDDILPYLQKSQQLLWIQPNLAPLSLEHRLKKNIHLLANPPPSRRRTLRAWPKEWTEGGY